MRKSSRRSLSVVVLLALGLAGCATMPSGPSVRVLPAPGKSFEQFMGEDQVCRQWAASMLGESPQHGANRSTAKSAGVGTLLGAGAGAMIGAATGSPGAGAAIGGGSGLLLGTAAGAGSGQSYGSDAQQRYDNTYVQCMYAKGNQIPGVPSSRRMYYTSPPNTVPPDYSPPR